MAEARLKKPDLARALDKVMRALAGAPAYALIGGVAVSARAEPRFTRDLDFMAAVPDDEGAEAFVHRLIQHGFRIVSVLENTKHRRLGTVRLRAAPDAPIVELLFASSGIEAEVVSAADSIVVLDRRLRVAKIGHLIALKLLARDDETRPQDAIDLRALARVATARERQRARAAVALIEKRGFARRRNLAAALERRRKATSAPGHVRR
ncbi:MAG TPA: nucleotidyl transferase AbiEii/AbiGii toxin family protein [Kofleriaceae bacterium]|nr:nucleotidyl transferase AbiEii/AbiGii toxin family protein [Kofleriaceae bacterium]